MKKLLIFIFLISLIGCSEQTNTNTDTINGEIAIYVTDSTSKKPIPEADIVFISGDKIIGKIKTNDNGRTTPVTVKGQFDDRFAIVKTESKDVLKHGVIQAVILKDKYYPGVILDIPVSEDGVGGAEISLDPIPKGVPVTPYTDNKIKAETPSKFAAGSLIKIIDDQFNSIKILKP